MGAREKPPGVYEVPTYEAPEGATWFHFLHGNVPGHQIDFIYRPTIPWGPLSRQHFGHLSRILQFIEPRDRHEQAFAIGNLSRDDTQYEPGHGGIALVLGLRVQGARDHAGREEPSFSHAMVAIDRDLDEAAFVQAALVFRQRLLSSALSSAGGLGFYQSYTTCGEDPDRAGALLRSYVAAFDDLPIPRPSRKSLRFTAEGIVQPRRIVIVHEDGLSFEQLARCAGRIAAVLYTSDVRWTVISNGRESDLPNGTTIRLVPASAGVSAEEGVAIHRLDDVPEDEEALAWCLFQAKRIGLPDKAGPGGWRNEYARSGEIDVIVDEEPSEGAAAEVKRPSLPRSRRWLGFWGMLALGIAGLGALWSFGGGDSPIEPPERLAEPATTEAPPEDRLPQQIEAPVEKKDPRVVVPAEKANERTTSGRPRPLPPCKKGDLGDCPFAGMRRRGR